MLYHLTRNQLLLDLLQAFYSARKHKSSKPYVVHFEHHLHKNLISLCNELWNRTYKPLPSACFIIERPKKREVFAAEFRDRIVHHLIYNYIHKMLERTFIQDSYSCIQGRGTHYGINRLEQHIRKESLDYSRTCYILKMDIKGYFMHIDRAILWDITKRSIFNMSTHKISKHDSRLWNEVLDIDFIVYLVRDVILLNPISNCIVHGSVDDWNDLPESKSLFYSQEGKGLPIGNLTSQLFSNVYLNELDQFVKRTLHCRHYGRYVDDFYIVSSNKEWLLSLVPQIELFLTEHLQLTLSHTKTHLSTATQGVEFLGAYLKPHRKYVANQSLRRMRSQIPTLHTLPIGKLFASINSFLGVLSHYKSYNIRRSMLGNLTYLHHIGTIDKKYHKLVLYKFFKHLIA